MHHSKSPQSPPAGQPKYIQDYSKALQKEIKILLAEVGKLRDERRSLQYEIAELITLKTKHSSGPDFNQPWMPQIEAGPHHGGMMMMMPPDLPPMDEPPPPLEPKPSGWRTVYKRPERKRKAITGGGGPQSQPTPPPMGLTPPPPMPEVPAWQNWRPNPLLAPTPVQNAAPLPSGPPAKQGLFGDVD